MSLTIEQPAAVWLDPKKLKPWGKNPRKNDTAVKSVADSMRRFGFGAPIVARAENNEIIAGHTRWKAAQLLGMKSVPVRLLDMSERDAHLLALADNKLGEIADWDTDAIGQLLSDVSFSDAFTAGWSGSELGKLADSILGAGEAADSYAKLGGDLKYQVVVECSNEDEQTVLLERFETEGLKCKPLIT